MRRTKPSKCPDCGTGNVVRIMRGEPTPEAEELAQAGLVILGGCIVFEGQPRWGCTACGSTWMKKPRR